MRKHFGQLNKAELRALILSRAATGFGFVAHKYKHSHYKARQVSRRLANEGEIKLVQTTRDTFTYLINKE